MTYIPYNTDVGFCGSNSNIFISISGGPLFPIHVYASIWVLLARFTVFKKTLAKQTRITQGKGYIYVTNVLITGPPADHLYANGGIYSRIAFVALAVLWMVLRLPR